VNAPPPDAPASAPAPTVATTADPAASAAPTTATASGAAGTSGAAPASTALPTASAGAVASAGAAPEAPPRIDETNVYGGASQAALGATAVPALLDSSGKPLPQTSDRPSTQSTTFGARMALLGEAISSGDANVALPAFFPSVAYAQVKDIPNPERDWEARLVSAFRRDIAEYAKKLGKQAPHASLVSVEVPEQSAKLMKPGSEGNRVPYYRVLRSKLHFRSASGREASLELTSMISWRGEWYVVHLHGFK
jgi:hypothetical protein